MAKRYTPSYNSHAGEAGTDVSEPHSAAVYCGEKGQGLARYSRVSLFCCQNAWHEALQNNGSSSLLVAQDCMVNAG